MEKWLFVVLVAWINVSCQAPKQEYLVGKWKLDSVHYHYNNFNHSSTGWYQEEIYEYLPTDELIVRAVDAYIKIPISINGREIHHLDGQGKPEETYRIIKLEKSNLVLQVENTPLFSGKNQTRYEIRYFSKVP
jgi:hypothetical protein